MLFLPRRKYRHLNRVLVSRSALDHNYHALQALQPRAKICPVLKSNAYGHGLVTVGKIVDRLGTPFLVVDSLYEAYELTKAGVRTPALILGYTFPENFRGKRLPYQYAVYDLEVAKALNKYQPGATLHLFLDTGMRREGIPLRTLPHFIDQLQQLKNVRIEGLASHFSDADNPRDLTFTRKQISVFREGLRVLREKGIDPQWRHISASSGALKIQDETFTLFRVGLASYGLDPLEESDPAYHALDLKPALRFVSTVVQIKEVAVGDQIGYGGMFRVRKKMRIGILPAGYYEGVDRRLSSVGVVGVRGKMCRILGRVSMNMTTIDLTGVPDAMVGDEAEIFGNGADAENSLSRQAAAARAIPYELCVHIAESVRREVVA